MFDSGHSLILESSESNGSSLKSAAMLGIALSVGASGALIPSPDAAVAANAPVPSTTTEAFSSDTATQTATAPVEASTQQIVGYHTIASGESLWQIAQQHGVGLQDLKAANALAPETSISVGQVLKVPASTLHPARTLARTEPVKVASAVTNTLSDSVSDTTVRPLNVTEVNRRVSSATPERAESASALSEMPVRPAVEIAEAPTEPVQPTAAESAQPVITAYAPAPSSYRVQSGDTLRSIASSLGTTPEALVRANSLIDPDVIFVGSTLVVPADAAPTQPLTKKATPVAEASQSRPVVANSDRLSRLRSMATTPDSATLLAQVRSATPTEAVSVGGEELTERDVLGGTSNTGGQDPYASNLLAEVEEIKTQSVQVSEAESVELKSDVAEPEEGTLLARADGSDRISRLSLPNRERVSTEATGAENSLQAADRAEVDPDLLAAAPLSPDTYIPAQRSAGQVVSPDMPLLPSEDEYLPEAPDYFDGYIWPTEGTITSGFGWRWGRMHRGVDVAGPIGTPIVAAAAGVVERAGWTSGGYGNIVEIRHPDGSMTRYAHNNSVIVSAGQSVKQGQQIAEMGSTGYSTGPHLHFEVYLNDDAVNPVVYLPSR